MPAMALNRLLRRDVASWCLYDWANSAYVTSVITVVLPVYFLSLTPGDGKESLRVGLGSWSYQTTGVALWSYITGFYMLAAGIAAPILGAVADQTGKRKKSLAACVLVGALLTLSLFLVTPGRYQLCALLFAAASFFWACGNLFYDALLPNLCPNDREMDAVSTTGYAVGYLGGGLLLALNLMMVQNPAWFGLSDPLIATRLVFVTVGLWWMLFSIPMLLFVQEQASANPVAFSWRCITSAVSELGRTLGHVRRYRQLFRLLLAFIFYNTGIGSVIVIAVPFAKSELGISTSTLIGCVLMIQMLGFPASFLFIGLARSLGTKRSILVGLGCYVGIVLFAYRMTSPLEFWILGALVGLVQGGTQALSRSLYGSMIPEGKSAEFFGFFSIFNKVGSFAGPLAFGIVRDMTDNSRLAILVLAAFLVVGAVILASVNLDAGRKAERDGRSGKTTQEPDAQ